MINEDLAHNCSAPDTRSFWQKMKRRCFPSKRVELPKAPSHFKDCIHGEAVTKFSFVDRLRILCTGVVVTHWMTVTENEVGMTIGAAECYPGTSDDLKGW